MIRYKLKLNVVMIVGLVAVAVLITSCGGDKDAPPADPPAEASNPDPTAAPTEAPDPTAAPTEAPDPTAAPTQEASGGGGQGRVDLDAIFPPGRGRELSLGPCAACHSFVPLVILQLTPEQWDQILRDHREKLPMVGEEDFLILEDYLAENFGPDDPVPELPEELLLQWTSY